jgi:hypothetical protein
LLAGAEEATAVSCAVMAEQEAQSLMVNRLSRGRASGDGAGLTAAGDSAGLLLQPAAVSSDAPVRLSDSFLGCTYVLSGV